MNTATIRDLLTAAFSDEELTTLCFDYFRAVYDNFSAGMSKGQKIQLLLDYCTRRDQFDQLLPLIRERNPAQYTRFESRPGRTGQTPQSKDASATSVSGGVDIQSQQTNIGGDVIGRDRITIVVGGKPGISQSDAGTEGDETSLRRQLSEAEANLKLIQERKSQYVLEVDVPLQLIKEERNLLERITDLKRQLGA